MTDDLERRFLLVKRGLYYAPDNHGYTGIKERAGRYLESDAGPDSGVTAIHEDEAPDYSPECFRDIAMEHLQSKLTEAADEIARLRAENEALKRAAVTAVLPLEALLLVGNVREKHSPELWEGIVEGAQAVRTALQEGSRHE